MIYPFEIEDLKQYHRLWTKEYVPMHQLKKAGWHAVNSVAPRDCLPSFRLAGGGVLRNELTDLGPCIDQCIENLTRRKLEAERLIERLEVFKKDMEEGERE